MSNFNSSTWNFIVNALMIKFLFWSLIHYNNFMYMQKYDIQSGNKSIVQQITFISISIRTLFVVIHSGLLRDITFKIITQ